VHPAQEVVRVADDLMATSALHVRDEADAAAVVLHLGAIEPVGRGPCGRRARGNHSAFVVFTWSHGFSLAENAASADTQIFSLYRGDAACRWLAARHRSCAAEPRDPRGGA